MGYGDHSDLHDHGPDGYYHDRARHEADTRHDNEMLRMKREVVKEVRESVLDAVARQRDEAIKLLETSLTQTREYQKLLAEAKQENARLTELIQTMIKEIKR